MNRKNFSDVTPFLDVELVPLFTQGGQESSRCAVILDPSEKHIEAGVVSKDYRLVSNLEARNIALDILTKTGLPFEERTVLFDGKRYLQRWAIPDFHLEPRPGDIVRLGLEVHNSYDGSSHFSLAFVAERLTCLNGMMVDFLLGGFRFRHYGENGAFNQELDQAMDSIRRLDAQSNKLLPAMQRMIGTSLDRREMQQIFNALGLPNNYLAKIFLAIEEDTEWGLYNACTRIMTELGSFRGEVLNRQVSHYFFADRDL